MKDLAREVAEEVSRWATQGHLTTLDANKAALNLIKRLTEGKVLVDVEIIEDIGRMGKTPMCTHPNLNKKVDSDNYYTGIYRTSDYIYKMLQAHEPISGGDK